MRSSSSARALAAALLGCCALLALAPAAFGEGRVDGSFGKNGFVDLGATLNDERGLGEIAVGPGGDIFVSEKSYGGCGHSLCFYDEWMKRYRADGMLAQRYLAGSAIRGTTTWVRTAVDSKGRPLLAWEKKGKRVLVRRLKPTGGVDREFGRAGTVALPCDCGLQSLAALPDGGVLVAAGRESGDGPDHHAIWYVGKLRPDGSGDPRFGGDGFVRLRMRGRSTAAAAPGPHGSVLLTSDPCCGESGPDVEFVSRLSPHGRLQHRFGFAYKRSQPSIYGSRIHELWEWMRVDPIPGGGIQGFASGWSQARIFRVGEDGRLDRSFGRQGVTVLPLRFADSAPDGEGGTFVVGWHRNDYYVRRLGRNGKPDPSFGSLRLPDAYNEEGLGIIPQGRGRAIIVARDLSFCRQECSSDPKLFRVLR